MKKINRIKMAIILSIFFIAGFGEYVFAHGSKGHDGNAFTNYDAVKESLAVFDKLLLNKKLNQEWESGFSTVTVLRTRENDIEEIVVKISRKIGKPETIFFFFNGKGKYKGSNFKGR